MRAETLIGTQSWIFCWERNWFVAPWPEVSDADRTIGGCKSPIDYFRSRILTNSLSFPSTLVPFFTINLTGDVAVYIMTDLDAIVSIVYIFFPLLCQDWSIFHKEPRTGDSNTWAPCLRTQYYILIRISSSMRSHAADAQENILLT